MLADLVVSVPFLETLVKPELVEQVVVVAEALAFVFVVQAWVQLHLLQLAMGAVLLLGRAQVSL